MLSSVESQDTAQGGKSKQGAVAGLPGQGSPPPAMN